MFALLSIIFVIFLIIIVIGISFLITAGLVYLISLCFGFVFTWKIAFGVWLIQCLLTSIFNVTIKIKD